MKPYGMTPGFQILTPSRAEDAIWEAVDQAIAAGMTPQRFRIEAAQAWEEKLRAAAKAAAKELAR